MTGRAFRSPGIYQLYYSGLTGRGRIRGNPDLAQESARTWEAELFGTSGPWRWEARATSAGTPPKLRTRRVASQRFFGTMRA